MKKTDIDTRVAFIVMVAAACLIFALKTEAALVSLMVILVLWLVVSGYPKEALKNAVLFAVLWGLVFPLSRNPHLGSLAMICIYARRMLLPFMAAVPISRGSTGKLIATLSRIRVPRIVTLSISIMFRFLPTIGTEYRLIRDSQKFRGIGTNILTVVIHPYRTLEYILVPLLIRTSKVADELSAAAMVRGMSLNGTMNPYTEVRWKKTDTLLTLLYGAAVSGSIVLDRTLQGVG
ncbi:energy-coupling factor transporter transmembrane component T family protein [Ruminococcus albus]|uniref:Cobalt transport protein n=1 Tax=Ruminococcus albus (strain ATCC 27210 / DSM 20455 / JCM 14654 / NCDO 2250 / 7) TaxID=697329 RepID=E6UIU7_RUMA7|nr:energy-coupling factor transporter transmembrane component T [Ruminococcus albus]ADU21399.1 cobalt transport protein [Ruminococcus albus 7 = DSM 20455]